MRMSTKNCFECVADEFVFPYARPIHVYIAAKTATYLNESIVIRDIKNAQLASDNVFRIILTCHWQKLIKFATNYRYIYILGHTSTQRLADGDVHRAGSATSVVGYSNINCY